MLALDPKYRLRKTRTNVLFYRFDEEALDLVDQKVLHPNTAILLSFFDGQNTLAEIESASKFLFELPDEHVSTALAQFVETWRPFMIEVDVKSRRDDPHRFVMPASDVDLTQVCCHEPLYLALALTEECGRNCVYCYADRGNPEYPRQLSFEQIAVIIEQCAAMNMEFLMLSGGDPFVRTDIIDILSLVIKAGIRMQLSTKQFLTPETIAQMRNIGVGCIQISIDCISDALAQKMVGVPCFASRSLKTIEMLQQAGIVVTTNSVVTDMNVHEIPALVERLASMGIPLIRLSQYHRSAYHHSDDLFVSNEKMKRLKDFVESFNSRKWGGRVHLSSFLDTSEKSTHERVSDFLKRSCCSFGRMSFFISANGKILPCEQLPATEEFVLGDATREPLIDVWNSKRLREFVIPARDAFDGTVCADCEHYDACVLKKGWCIRDAWKAFGRSHQVHSMCPKAEATPGRRLY
jgi:radical SAM protein with 4Fe4S-binding SPASM domain